MSFSVPRRKVAALALASTGLATVLAGAFAPAASAAPSTPTASSASAAKSDWFVDPRTPAQRKAQVAVPKKPGAYQGKLKETRAVYRTKAGALAVPMRFAFGNTVAKGQAVTLDGNGLFVVNTTTLTTAAKSQIRQLAAALGNASSVRCEGYADYAGAAKRNNQLARDRAANVCDYLVSVSTGLKATTVSYGPTWPAVVGGDSEARRLNRRVVVEMTGTKPAGPVAPQANVPGAPVLENLNGWSSSVYYAWSAPTDDGGSPITDYQVSTGSGWAPVQMQLGRAAKADRCRGGCEDYLYGYLTDVAPGSLVNLRVRAVNAVGAGAPSNTLSTQVYDVPGVPTSVTATVDGTTVSLAFAAPAFTGGTPITGYEVRTDDGGWEPVSVTGSSPYTVELTGQTAGSHTYAVRAVNAVGSGAEGVSDVTEVLVVEPGAPVPYGQYFASLGMATYWTLPDPGTAQITGWQISLEGGAWRSFSTVYDLGSPTGWYGDVVDCGGPSCGGQVTFFRVRAVTATGFGAPSDTTYMPGFPD